MESRLSRSPKERLSAEDTVRTYKSLSQVELAFRSLKGIDLLVRPIRHRTQGRVPAHIFLCMLAYYVQWHMRGALAPILFQDDELPQQRKRRDPILPAQPSQSAEAKKNLLRTPEGLPVHSFETLLADLASRGRNTYRVKFGCFWRDFQAGPRADTATDTGVCASWSVASKWKLNFALSPDLSVKYCLDRQGTSV